MGGEMESATQLIKELLEEKTVLLKEKTFGEVDSGDVYPKEAVHKILEFLTLGFKKLSQTLTKMTILLSERPLPKIKEMTPLFNELSEEIKQFYEICTTFYPIYCGALLKHTYREACLFGLEVIADVMSEILTDVFNKEKQLAKVGRVWETCEKIQALPQDLVQLSLLKCDTEYECLVDAEEEMKNEIKDHQESDFNFDDSSWSEEDLKLLTPAAGLIKVCHCLIKKVKPVLASARLGTKEEINDVERVCRGIMSLSPGVDDLVTSLYPPLVQKQVNTSANSLLSSLDSLLGLLPTVHFTTSADTQWIDFLKNATQHNGSKLLNSLTDTCHVNKQMEELNIT